MLKRLLYAHIAGLAVLAAGGGYVAAAVATQVAWNQQRGPSTPQHFGLNIWGGVDPAVAERDAYKANLERMSPGIVRFHASEMVASSGGKSWVDYTARQWDASKIGRSLAATLPQLPQGGQQAMINIPGGQTGWMRTAISCSIPTSGTPTPPGAPSSSAS